MRNLLLTLVSLVTLSCEYDYNLPLYDVGDVVIIEPDSSVVEIIDWVAWADSVKYTVEYTDTIRKDIIHEEEIISYLE